MAASKVAKLVAVFGVGANLTATYDKTNVVYKDAAATLTFARSAEEGDTDNMVGVYDVTIVSETEVKETFAPEQPAPVKEAKAKSLAPQSPSFGYQSKPAR